MRAKEGFGERNAGERGFNQIQGNGNCRAYRFREHVSVIEDARIIGRVTAEHPSMVVMRTPFGTTRIVDMLAGDQLPRIC